MLRALFAAGLFAAMITAPAFSKDKSGKTHHEVSVTGCLAQGDEANEYAITGQDGKTYGLRSSSVDLKQHLGHKVTVMGMTSHEKAEKTEAKTGKPEESAHLKVTSLTMVSTSCQ